MCIKALSQLLGDRVSLPAALDVTVHGITADSRRVRQGDLFIALRGSHGDPRRYVPEALARGAVAILLEGEGEIEEHHSALLIPVPELSSLQAELADRFYEAPSRRMTLVGVTGTNGKTSVAWFLTQILNYAGIRTAMLGTLGYGFPGALQEASHTTPDPVRLQGLLYQFWREGARAVVMEVSSHALDQGRVEGVRFAAGVFTNLSRDHLDYHGSLAVYGEAKARLFSVHRPHQAMINVDDPFGRQLAERFREELDLWRFSLHEPDVECTIQDPAFSGQGFRARLRYGSQWLDLAAPLLGTFNLSNVLAAATVALAQGVDPDGVAEAVGRLEAPPGRLESFEAGNGVRIVVDYAHTPDALANALEALRPHVEGRLWCLFGCGGDRDTGKRPLMGAEAERRADRVILTDDNPRSEAPGRIVADIVAGLDRPERAEVIHDRPAAIRYAVDQAEPGDLILIAGKGHERFQERRGERIPYSDVDQVHNLLTERGGAA